MTHTEFQNRFIYNPTTDRLGKGGFGEVFKAYDTYRDRWVAVKMAKVEADHEMVRLRKEVELVNQLPAHPNIAYYEECYTFESFAGEYDFGILQYYEAGNLQQLIERNNLTFAQKQNLLTQLLEGIGFLHAQGIIHRDLKPANILIVKRGEEYIPKITDFGISKKLDINNSSVFGNSLAGAGTLSFASPEQLGGTTIRKNTDLWSFGVIAYWILAGELPFNTGVHGTTSEAGRAELFSQIAKGTLPQGITAINQPWRKLIVACLETDSEKRVRNVEECRELLSGNHLTQQDKTQLISNSNPEPVKPNSNVKPTNQHNELVEEKLPTKSNKSRTISLIALYGISVIFALIACFVGENSSYSSSDYEDYATDSIAVDTVALVNTISVKDFYQIDIPYDMSLMESDKPEDADVMYGNDNCCFLSLTEKVYDLEDYVSDLNGYSKLVVKSLKNTLPDVKLGNLEEITLDNGEIAYQVDYTFTNEGSEYYAIKTIVRIGDNYHQLYSWCLADSRDTYELQMKYLHKSIRQL